MNKMNWQPAYRLVVFVPEMALDKFMKAVSADIPSFLGPYDHVAWWSESGIEQFRPLESAHPVSGEHGAIEHELCRRVELSLPFDKDALDRFVRDAIKIAHPWEKPVIYIYETTILGS